jgi:cytochrome c-type biogenesis protein
MILSIFEWLSGALQSTPGLALLAAFVWGILSVILSPCHLASIPLIIGFINEQGVISVWKAFKLSLLFAIGILTTIAIIGGITASLGMMLGNIGNWGNYIVAVLFFLFGLYLLGIIPMSWGTPGIIKQKGYWAALLIGLVFGVALGPCTFAYLAPVLGLAFKISATNLIFAVLLLVSFGLGHCLVIVLAGTLTEKVQQYLNWSEKSKVTSILRKASGILVLLVGVYLIYLTLRR